MGLIFYFLVLLALMILGVTVIRTGWFDAPFVPSGSHALKDIFGVIKIRPGEVFYDLGSGDGRVVREAARRGAKATGFERAWSLVLWSRFVWWVVNLFRKRGKNIQKSATGQAIFVSGNYLKADLSKADTIFCYLLPKAMVGLKEKFERELKPGTRVVSRAFKIHDWTPVERFQFAPRTMPVYVYTR